MGRSFHATDLVAVSYISHSRTKGSKNGQRLYQEFGTNHWTELGKLRYGTGYNKSVYEAAQAMTNEELKAAVERKNAVDSFTKAYSVNSKTGEKVSKFAEKILDTALDIAGKHIGNTIGAQIAVLADNKLLSKVTSKIEGAEELVYRERWGKEDWKNQLKAKKERDAEKEAERKKTPEQKKKERQEKEEREKKEAQEKEEERRKAYEDEQTKKAQEREKADQVRLKEKQKREAEIENLKAENAKLAAENANKRAANIQAESSRRMAEKNSKLMEQAIRQKERANDRKAKAFEKTIKANEKLSQKQEKQANKMGSAFAEYLRSASSTRSERREFYKAEATANYEAAMGRALRTMYLPNANATASFAMQAKRYLGRAI